MKAAIKLFPMQALLLMIKSLLYLWALLAVENYNFKNDCRIRRDNRGEIFIDEKVVNDVSPKDRDIAMVFQNYALYPHMSVYDNMAFGLKVRKS